MISWHHDSHQVGKFQWGSGKRFPGKSTSGFPWFRHRSPWGVLNRLKLSGKKSEGTVRLLRYFPVHPGHLIYRYKPKTTKNNMIWKMYHLSKIASLSSFGIYVYISGGWKFQIEHVISEATPSHAFQNILTCHNSQHLLWIGPCTPKGRIVWSKMLAVKFSANVDWTNSEKF